MTNAKKNEYDDLASLNQLYKELQEIIKLKLVPALKYNFIKKTNFVFTNTKPFLLNKRIRLYLSFTPLLIDLSSPIWSPIDHWFSGF